MVDETSGSCFVGIMRVAVGDAGFLRTSVRFESCDRKRPVVMVAQVGVALSRKT